MAPAKHIVIHHVRGRLKGLRRIVGSMALPEGAGWPTALSADEGDGLTTFSRVGTRPKYVLYREFNTPSLLLRDGKDYL